MDSTQSDLDDIVTATEYFQECLENILSVLQPTFFCLDFIVKILIHGPEGCGKRLLAKTAAKKLSMNFHEERIADMFDENIIGTEKKVKAAIIKASTSAPCIYYLTGYELFCKLDEPDLDRIEHCIRVSLEELIADNSQPFILIASSTDFDQVYHSPLSDIFQHYIQVNSPTKAQGIEILRSLKIGLDLELEPSQLLGLCTNREYYLGNLWNIVFRSELDRFKAAAPISEDETSELQRNKEGTRWLDIGGLSDIKREIIDAIQLSLDFPQLKKSGLRRTGILLYGPPGTGKTLLAKAVATECDLNFINVKGPELLNEYVGQSEDNIRKLFQKARESSPSVIFFDELDSLAPNRGQAGDSGGVMDRMVSQLLAEMDGVGKSDDVFVIGATNRVDLVDPSLLRPGRFDKVLEVAIPVSKENRIQILEALTRKMNLSDDVNLSGIESILRPGMSGADFQGLCSRALHNTFDRCVEQVESGQCNEDEVEMITTMEDFLQSIDE